MDEALANAVFKPKPSRQEAKADSTARIAQAIIDGEAAARDAKTARLRALRLANEATSEPKASKAKTAKKSPRKR